MQQAQLTASDGAAGDDFGRSVALAADTALVGAFVDDVGTNADQGSAYAYQRSGTTWTQQAQLTASDGAANDKFGYSVALAADTALVGAFFDDVGASVDQGSAYAYQRSGTTWTQQAQLTAGDGAANDQFGLSVALAGDTAMVGAQSDDVGANGNQGSAYVYLRSGVSWTQQAKLTASDGAANDQFGASIALVGDTVLVGANLDDLRANSDQGSAYVYQRSGSTWSQEAQLTSGAAGDADALNLNIVGSVVYASAVQPDGKTIIGGQFSSVLGQARSNIARLNADGTLDMGFNPNVIGDVFSIALQADGQILLGGNFTTVSGSTRNRIARVAADGTLDVGFNPNANGIINSIALQADGQILLGGAFTIVGGSTRNRIARVDAATGLADPFNPNANGEVRSVALQTDGQILLGGAFTVVGGSTRNRVARVNAATSLADFFNPNVSGDVHSIAVQANGQILIGGFFASIGGTTNSDIARVAANGTVDATFNPALDGGVYSIAVQADGQILLGGSFTNVGGLTRNRIARLAANGVLDAGFNPNANDLVRSIAAQADGQILLGGNFTTVGGLTRNYFARLLNDPATQSVSAVNATQVLWTRGGSAPDVSQTTFELSTNGGTSYTPLGGTASRVGTTANWQLTGLTLPASGQLRARARAAGGYNNGSAGMVEQVFPFTAPTVTAISPNAGITSGGTGVTITGTGFTGATAVTIGGVAATDVDVISATSISATTVARAAGVVSVDVTTPGGTNAANTLYTYRVPGPGDVDALNLSIVGSVVYASAVQPDGKTIIGGLFSSVLGQARNNIARLNVDGTLDMGFNPDANDIVNSIAVQADGQVLLGGDFTTVDGIARNFIARLAANGTLDAGFNPNASGSVRSIAVQADGQILLGGFFTSVGGSTRNRIARLAANGTLDAGFDPNVNNFVYSVAVQADGQILLGGFFTSVGGSPRNRIARVAANGTLDAGFDPNAGGGSVRSIAVQADGQILLGGFFTSVGGSPRNYIARVATNGTLDAGFDPNANQEVSSIALQADGQILLGGFFSTVGGSTRNCFARLLNDPATQSLDASNATQVLWTRGGSAPDVSQTTFELSTNGGVSYTPLGGTASRVGTTANWQLSGLSLPASGQLRARGRTAGGYYNGSAGIVEQVVPFTVAAPTVTAITPNTGSTTGGTNVTITGTGFTGATAVTIGGVAATGVNVISATSITAVTGARAAGAVSVDVTTSAGTNAANTLYTYRVPVPGDIDALDLNIVGSFVLATAVQPDGKTIMGGKFSSVFGQARNNIARLNADGTLDAGFNPNVNDDVRNIALQADGQILLGGTFTTVGGSTRNFIARVAADGTLDAGFNPNANNLLHSIAVQADGHILLGGSFTTVGGVTRNGIARVAANGTLDAGFDPNANDTVLSIAVQADGQILLGGFFTSVGGTPRNYIARLAASGTLDAGFNPNADNGLFSIAVQADGQILLGGFFTNVSGSPRNRIARLAANGTLDAGFNPNVSNVVNSIALQADGQILLGGEFFTVGGIARNRIARVAANGTLDAAFNPNADGEVVYNIALQADGQILLGGQFTSVGGSTRNLFARLLNDPATQSLTASNATQVLWTRGGSAPDVSQTTFELSTNGGSSYTPLGGTASRVGRTANWQLSGLSLPASGQLRARGRTAGGYGNGTAGIVEQVATFTVAAPTVTAITPNNGITTGGTNVTITGTGFIGATAVTIGGVAASGVSVVSATSITAVTGARAAGAVSVDVTSSAGTNAANTLYTYRVPVPGDVGPLNLNIDGGGGVVYASAVQPDGKTIIAGSFSSVLGQTRNNIARLNADGTLEAGFNPNVNEDVLSIAVQADGQILLSGNFTAVGGTPRNRIARVAANGTLDAGFNPNVNNIVYSIAVQADGQILLGGFFTSVGGSTRNRIARLNADGTLDAGFNPNANRGVRSIAVQADGQILLGGDFSSVGGLTRNRIARVATNGTLDAGFNPNANEEVYSIAVQADGQILLGGNFTTVSGTPRKFIARLAANGTLDAGFNPNANNEVESIALQADGQILLGGSFSTVGGSPRGRIARLAANGTLDAGFDPNADQFVVSIALQADGQIQLGGGFGTVGGSTRNKFARLLNGPATQSLIAADATQVLWTRGGSSPELSQTTFELSTNGGVSYTPLGGTASRVGTTANWQLSGLNLPSSGQLRARGRTAGGYSNGTAGIVEQVVPFTVAAPTVSAITPNTGISSGGTNVTITGTGFIGATAVTIGGVAATGVSVVSATSITAVTGARAAGAVSVDVTTSAGTNAANTLYTYRVPGPGDVDALSLNLVGGYVYASAVQPDGKTVIAGQFSTVLGQARNNIARLNADGTLDAGFNPNANNAVFSIAVQADGQILLGGGFTAVGGSTRNRIARVAADGTLDADFNPNPNDAINSIAVQADGQILLGGRFTAVGGSPRNYMARVAANGTLDAGFNPNANSNVFSIALEADGQILLGGGFTNVGGSTRNRIARVAANGTLDAGFDPNANSLVYNIAVQADGQILFGGFFTTVSGLTRNRIARVAADGTLDAGFNPNANSDVYSIAVQADGQILLGGFFTTVSGVTRNRIARLAANGTPDAGFNPNANNQVNSIAVQADGQILLGGRFSSVGGSTRNLFARLLNDPATQTLTATNATQVLWTRGGSAPDVSQTTFELSTNAGASYTPLGGTAIRVGSTANWQLSGLSLPASGQLRARGRTAGGYNNGSAGIVEQVVTFSGLGRININDVTLTEGNAGTTNATFSVSLSAPAGPGGVSFDIATANGTAIAGADYVASALTGQTIPSGSSTYTFTVQVNGDSVDEANETFLVNVSNVSGATIADGQGQGTITDDDTAGILLTPSAGSTNVIEGGPTDDYTVVLTSQPTASVTVNLSPTQVSSIGTVSFTTADWNVPQTVTVTALDDMVVEGAHGGSISHSTVSTDPNYSGLSANLVVAVTDNDSASYQFTSAASTAGEASGSVTSTVSLSFSANANALAAPITVPIAFTGSATGGGTDYTLSANSVVIPTNGASQTVTATLVDDSLGEGNETLILTLGDETGGSVGQQAAVIIGTPPARTITITDNDLAITPATLPNGRAAVSYSQTFSTAPGATPYAYAVTAGALPAGLSLSPTGTLSGTPTAVGSFNFTVTSTDSGGSTGTRAYTLVIDPPLITISPTTLPNPLNNVAYSQQLTASGGNPAYAFNVSAGALPSGINISPTGLISGTTTASGIVTFTVRACDTTTGPNTPYCGTQAYTLILNTPPVANPNSYTVLEDQVLTVAAPGVLDNDTDIDPGTTLTVNPAVSAPITLLTGNVAGTVAITTNGALSYTPSANTNGSGTASYFAFDGNVPSVTAGLVTITVTPVNDAPSFTTLGDRAEVAGASGNRTVNGFVNNVSFGPSNESSQTVSAYLVSEDSDPANIVSNVAISTTGTLTYTLADVPTGGTATIRAQLRDSGGTDNGGVDLSAPQTFRIVLQGGSDLGVVLYNGRDLHNGGGLVNYVIVVRNAGPIAINGARVLTTLASQITPAAWTCSASGGATCTANGNGSIDQLVNLPVAADVRFDLTTTLALLPEGPFSSSVTITPPAPLGDRNPNDNTATDNDRSGLFANNFEQPIFVEGIDSAPEEVSLNNPANGKTTRVLRLPAITGDPMLPTKVLRVIDSRSNTEGVVEMRQVDGQIQLRASLRQQGQWAVGNWKANAKQAEWDVAQAKLVGIVVQ